MSDDPRPEDDPARIHGIPEQVHHETPTAYPTSDRHETESVANKTDTPSKD